MMIASAGFAGMVVSFMLDHLKRKKHGKKQDEDASQSGHNVANVD
jgi:hypothetical protein